MSAENEAAPAPTSAARLVAGGETETPAAETAPPAEAPAAEAPPADAKWRSGIENDEVRGFAESKNWGSAEEAIKSYKNLEAMRGVPEEELARLPKDGDAEGLAKLMRRLGAPEEATGYELEGLEGEDLEWTQKTLHEYNIPQAAAKGLLAAQAERIAATKQAMEEAYLAQSEKDLITLKQEWGAAADHNIEAAKRAVQRLGVDEAEAMKLEQALGTTRFMKLFAEHGNATAEAGFVDTDSVHSGKPFGMSPGATEEAVRQFNADPANQAQLMHNDPAVRMAAVARRREIYRRGGISGQ